MTVKELWQLLQKELKNAQFKNYVKEGETPFIIFVVFHNDLEYAMQGFFLSEPPPLENTLAEILDLPNIATLFLFSDKIDPQKMEEIVKKEKDGLNAEWYGPEWKKIISEKIKKIATET